MKKNIFILLLTPFALFSQSGFNTIYDLSTSVAFSGVVSDGEYILMQGVIRNDTTDKWDLIVIKADTFGYIQQIFQKSSEWEFNTLEGDFIKTSDGGYLIEGDHIYSTRGFTLKLNQNLEEEFFKTFYDSVNYTVFHREAVEVSDGYIIGSEIQMLSWDNQAWAMKLDYEGNEVWYHQYGSADTSETVTDMDILPNGNVIIAGVKNNTQNAPPEDFWVKPWYLIIDAVTGEIIEEKVYGMYAPERVTYANYSLPDGTYLTGGNEKVNQTSFSSRLSVRHLDNEGNLIWKKNYGPNIVANVHYMYKIMPMGDGRFVAVGRGAMETASGYADAAITICFNPEDGEEYWVRTDTIPIDTINNTKNYVQGGTVLSSGSVVVAGYNNTGRSYGWLLKMDKNGCIQDDCETYTAVEDVREVVALPVLFPNPAESYFSIKGEHEGDIGIYSVSGRLVKTVAENLTFGEIGVGDLPKGLYFVRGQTDGRVWVLKLVR